MSRQKLITSILIRTLENQKNGFHHVRYRGNYTLYNTLLAKEKEMFNMQRHQDRRKQAKIARHSLNKDKLPISLKYLSNSNISDSPNIPVQKVLSSTTEEEIKPVQFPFQNNMAIESPKQELEDTVVDDKEVMRKKNELCKEMKSWMLNYDNFDDNSLTEDLEMSDEINYGTPDPNSVISNIPCGGCGAYLHCKDHSLPGYIPSEIFKNSSKKGCVDLTALICQRCYFLKHHNIALEVQVSNEDYPKILQTISTNKGVVVLMVDITDFPCSIWPGIADIFHNTPIIVAGNKVDLLPKDSPKFLQYVKRKLGDYVKSFGFATTKLIDVVLISAATGYGVEELITKLHGAWRFKGDVFIVGCTNVGKSTLFNQLIQSDYCKSQAEDLIQRATTSIWPGTTLNLLKFPISKPGGYKLQVRKQRLKELQKLEKHENMVRDDLLRQTKNWKYAVLMGRIDRTNSRLEETEVLDSFSVRPSNKANGRIKLGVNEKDPVFALSRWCYDTPGVVQPDQILHLLTSEELYFTIPKTVLVPRCFCVRPGESLFIGGLSRLDFLEGEESIRITVFASFSLPISLCKTLEADEFYNKYVGTEYLKVPTGGEDRLKKWPGLQESKCFTVHGIDFDFSAKDVVLSNSGWMSITPRTGQTCRFKAWTPEKRGVHVRDCLLPQAVNLRGPRIRSSPAYEIHCYFDEIVGENDSESKVAM